MSEKEESLSKELDRILKIAGNSWERGVAEFKALIQKREEMAWDAAREFFDNPTQSGIIINLSKEGMILW